MTTYTYPQLLGLAQNAGFTGQSAHTAAAIALAESSGNPNSIAYNDGGKGYNSYGLMQINGVNDKTVGGAVNALDPQTSFNQAYILSNGGTNFRPWSTYNSGAYRQYLNPSATPDTSAPGGDYGGGGTDPNASFGPTDPGFGGSPQGTGTDSTSPGGTVSGGTNAQGVAAQSGQGMPVQVNVGPQTATDLQSFVTAPIKAAENWASAQFAALSNWFTRGFLIILAIVIIMVALWKATGSPNVTEIARAA